MSGAAEEAETDDAVGDEQEGAEEQAELESAWTPEWDRTPQTLAWLRMKRAEHRRRRSRDLAVVIYAVVLMAVGYGSTVIYRFLQRLVHDLVHGATADAIRHVLPGGFALLTVALALLAARDALWRGPVVVAGPDAGWLLAQPVDRARVLRPKFRLTALIALIGGLLCTVGGAVVLHFGGLDTPFGTGLLACLPAGVCLPLLAVALGGVVEARPGLARRVRTLTPYAAGLLVLLAVQAGWAVAGHRIAPLEWFELWSGPWGWSAQPIVRAAGTDVPGWWAGTVLLVVLTVLGVWRGHRDASAVPNAQLRDRAATSAAVASVLYSVELRAAKLAVTEATAGESRWQPRLPMPRSRRLLVPWRDALALLRDPGRLGKSVLWTAAAAAVLGLALPLPGADRTVGLFVALLCGYAAVGTLAEPARVESDDLRRSSWSPFRFATLQLQHTVVPAAVGVVLGLLAAVPFALRGGAGAWALLLMPLCALPFGAASVLAASRGSARPELMSSGVVTPSGGDPGFLLFLVRYFMAPLLAVAVQGVALGVALAKGVGGGSAVGVAVVSVLLAAALLGLARRAAAKLRRTGG